MANQRNIIVGAANFWIGSLGTALKVSPGGTGTVATTLADVASAGFRGVGYTQEGVEVSYEPDYGDVEVDQLLDSARIFKQGMRVTVNTTMAEATLENLLIIWGQEDDSLATAGTGAASTTEVTIQAGSLGEAPLSRSLLFVGPAPVTTTGTGASLTEVRNERVYNILNAVQTESSSFALRRSEATGLPASFRCLPYDGATSGGPAYGRITDRAATELLTNVA
jgi:hypothetical protein